MTTPNYRTSVARVFAGLSADPIFNGTIDHACVIIEEGFKAACHTVRLLTHGLDAMCYGQPSVLGAAKLFLKNPDARLHILVENPSALADCRVVLDELIAAGGHRVTVRVVPAELVARYGYNMMVVDEVGYRFEPDRDEHRAVVAGGPVHAANTQKLTLIFDALEAQSEPVPERIAA